MLYCVIPEKPGWRIRKGIDIALFHTIGVTPRKRCKALFHVIGGDRGRTPLMPIRAQDPTAVGIVEQHKLLHQLVLIGSYLSTKNAKVTIPSSLLQIPEYLIVGSILLDDVNHMFDGARFPDSLGYRAQRLIGSSCFPRRYYRVIAHVSGDLFRQCSKMSVVVWDGDQRYTPVVLMGVEPLTLAVFPLLTRQPLDIRNQQSLFSGVHRNRAGEPTHRNHADHFGFATILRVKIKNGNRILCPVGHIQTGS